ncbi:MAG: dihydropteroate synthase [Bacteroidetes bacterium HGW-Bacteroidetes-13]|nr:MAG: dihydropteroate synthase [Bacteroidetes bacterium HGW-Bacteroidetes-13]
MTINCNGRLIDLSIPKVMGILNLTPDSFFDGGLYKDEQSILQQIEKMLREGADFIDLGAYSSRPNAAFVTLEEERKRLMPVIELVLKKFPEILLSVDTFRHEIAQESINAGAAIINDISGGQFDNLMFETVSKLKVPYILMHLKGNLESMHLPYDYTNLTQEINLYFAEKVYQLRLLGHSDIILDPGFGFSKNLHQNYALLNELELLKANNLPILVGLSRKSMIYKLLKITPDASLNGTTALQALALYKGAKLLRVHDVKEAVECVNLLQAVTA